MNLKFNKIYISINIIDVINYIIKIFIIGIYLI